MKFKKGISGVVATVLILLITVAAAGILVSFIFPFIQENLDSSSECLKYGNYLKFEPEFDYTCYENSGLHGFSVRAQTIDAGQARTQEANNESTVTGNASSINAGNNENIKGFNVVLTKQGDSRKVDVFQGLAASSAVGGVRLLDRTINTIAIPRDGEVQTYVYNSGGEIYDSIEIYPVLNSGRICDVTDKIQIRTCQGVSLS